jgi:hypothetical protein
MTDEKQQHLDFMEAQRIALIMNSAISGAKIDVICIAYAPSMGGFASLVPGTDPVHIINNIAQRALVHAYGMSDEPPSVQ